MVEYLPSFNKDSGFNLQVWGHRRQRNKKTPKNLKTKTKKPYNLTVCTFRKSRGQHSGTRGRGITTPPLAQELTANGFWMRKICYFCLFV